MKKITVIILALAVLLTALAGCGKNKDADTGDRNAAADTAPKDAETTAAEPETEEPTEANAAELQLGPDTLLLRITEVKLDEESKLVISIEGITFNDNWRSLKMDAVLDGETYFLEKANISTDSYTRTSGRTFEKLPEQIRLYADDEQNVLVYDVAGGSFVR